MNLDLSLNEHNTLMNSCHLTAEEILLRKKSINDASEKSGVYFLIQDNTIVYVGQSKVGVQRIKSHLSSPDKPKKYNYFYFKKCPVDLLDEQEAYYILLFKPKYNLRIPINFFYKTINNISSTYDIHSSLTKKIIRENKIKSFVVNHSNKKVLRYFNLYNFEKILYNKYKKDIQFVAKRIDN